MPSLSDDQKTSLHQWAADGATLNDIQKRLKTEFDLSFTYMETRFLASDLELKLRDPVAEAKKKEEEEAAKIAAEAELLPDDPDPAPSPGGSGSVALTTDSITKPGTVVSGGVTFSDGKTATWYLDEMGRLGFDPDEPGYRPSEADAMAFQDQLQRTLQQQGGI